MRINKQSEVLQFYKTGRNTKTQQQIEDGKKSKLTLESWETGLESSKK
jgi:hypothetical protein